MVTYSKNAELHAQMEEMEGEIEDLKNDNIGLQQDNRTSRSQENNRSRTSRSIRFSARSKSKRRKIVSTRNPY